MTPRTRIGCPAKRAQDEAPTLERRLGLSRDHDGKSVAAAQVKINARAADANPAHHAFDDDEASVGRARGLVYPRRREGNRVRSRARGSPRAPRPPARAAPLRSRASRIRAERARDRFSGDRRPPIPLRAKTRSTSQRPQRSGLAASSAISTARPVQRSARCARAFSLERRIEPGQPRRAPVLEPHVAPPRDLDDPRRPGRRPASRRRPRKGERARRRKPEAKAHRARQIPGMRARAKHATGVSLLASQGQ